MTAVAVRLEDGRHYDVVVGHGVLAELGDRCQGLGLGRRCALIGDAALAETFVGTAAQSLRAAGFDTHSYQIVVPSFGLWGFTLAARDGRVPTEFRITEASRFLDDRVMAQASVFPKGFPEIYMHLRRPVLEAPPETRQECLIFYELAKEMGLDYSTNPIFAALEAAIEAGEPAPVLSAIKGVSMLFAMNHSQALQEEGTISGEGNAVLDLEPLADHAPGRSKSLARRRFRLETFHFPKQAVR